MIGVQSVNLLFLICQLPSLLIIPVSGAGSLMGLLASPYATYLDRMVERKKIEVDLLLRQHQNLDDPLVMRMSYMASVNHYNLTKSLKRAADGKEKLHTMGVLVDLKRRSPTIPDRRNIVEFEHAGKFAELLTLAGADAFLVNTDKMEYGGSSSDLKDVIAAVKKARPLNPPACIVKDIIIHPVQV